MMRSKTYSCLFTANFIIWMWLSISTTFLKADNLNTLHQINCFSMETLEDSTLWEGLAGTFFGSGICF